MATPSPELLAGVYELPSVLPAAAAVEAPTATLFAGLTSAPSVSDASDRLFESFSGAYLHTRLDLRHCEHGQSLSHLSLRLRHSVHDLTGRGRLTLRGCEEGCTAD